MPFDGKMVHIIVLESFSGLQKEFGQREYDNAYLPAINGDFYEKNIYNNDAGSHRGFSEGERVLR